MRFLLVSAFVLALMATGCGENDRATEATEREMTPEELHEAFLETWAVAGELQMSLEYGDIYESKGREAAEKFRLEMEEKYGKDFSEWRDWAEEREAGRR